MGPGQELQASTGGRSAALRVAAISVGKDRRDGESLEECAVRAGRAGATGAISRAGGNVCAWHQRARHGMGWRGEGAWGRWVCLQAGD